MQKKKSLQVTRNRFVQQAVLFTLLVCLFLLAAVLGKAALRSTKAAPPVPPPSNNELWQDVPRNSFSAYQSESLTRLRAARTLRLNRTLLAATLAQAPLEAAGKLSPARLSLPLPDGRMASFRLETSPVLPPRLAAQYPEIQSYRGDAVDVPGATMRCDLSPRGFHATILLGNDSVTIQRANLDSADSYLSYLGSDERAEAERFGCEVKANPAQAARLEQVARTESDTNGATRRTFRLAIATTQEYTNIATLGGGTVSTGLASVVTWLNAVNLIYEQDMAVRFVLAEGNEQVIFTAEPDGLTNGNNTSLLTETPVVLNAKIGAAKYDVGHVLHVKDGGSGVALLGVVCGANEQKGAGVTAVDPDELPGAPFSTSTLAHEIGHQFGATHTFAASCDSNRQDETAFESASGLTLMSYAGVCSPAIVATVRPYFHSYSIAQMLNYIGTNGGCAMSVPTNNNPPVINVGTAHTIPKLTPFVLTATATDADGGDVPNLRYSWEQADAGPTPPYVSATGPLFRPFPLTPERARTFPRLTYILNNANVPPATIGGFETAESLPAVARALTFKAIVRDLRGGIGADQVVITVADSGPFLVTAPNAATTWTGGATQTVTWSVNGTNAAPVNCANVKISFSLDGGNTFPHVLTASAPNSGTATVNVPAGLTTQQARVKVEAVGNIFFDLSNANFTLTPGDACPAISGIAPQIGAVGSNVTIKGVNFTNVTGVKFANNVTATFLEVNETTLIAQVPPGAVDGPITISKGNCADKTSTVFTLSASAPSILQVDDGTIENAQRAESANSVYYVNRLTPANYPATITALSIFVPGSMPLGTDLNLLVGINPNSNATLEPITFQTVPIKTTGLAQFFTFAVPNITITTGDFVVGFSHVPQENVFPIGVDSTPPVRNRSYVSTNLGNTFNLNTTRNFAIRAEVSAGAICSGAQCNAVNTPPTITAGAAVARAQASTGSATPLATVSDGESSAGSLLVTATSVPAGITISNITNTNGNITATIAAACNAALGSNSVQLTVSDGSLTSTANLTVNVTANTAPTAGTYPAAVVGTGQTVNVTPSIAPNDNGAMASITATAPNFTGSFSGNAATGVLTVTNAGPLGVYTVTVTATDNCGATATTTFQLTVSISVAYEADVAPRPNGNGNGTVSIADWTQVGRFVVGLDTAANGSEFQRADVAPLATFGNGSLTIADWVQAGRYAAGLDPVAVAAGPTAPAAPLQANVAVQVESTRLVRTRDQVLQRGQVNAVPLLLEAAGNENALSFTVNYDPALLSLHRATAPNGTLVTINAKHSARGMVGLLLALPAGKVFEAGQQALVSLEFIPNGGVENVTTTLSFGSQIVAAEVADAAAVTVPGLSFANATLTISGQAVAHVSAASYLGPAAANDSMISAFGQNLSTMIQSATTSQLPSLLGGTRVMIQDSTGNEQSAALFFVSPNQINYLVPSGLAEGLASVTITNAAGAVARGLLTLTRVAPAIFTAEASGKGYAAADVQRVRSDGSSVYDRVASFVNNRLVGTPIELRAEEQTFLVLYGTGIKQRSALPAIRALIGGLAAEVLYAGPQGQYAGLDQINLRLPSALRGRGEIIVELELDGQLTNPVKIFVK